MQVIPVPLLKDNYSYLLRDDATQRTAVIDPSEAPGVIAALEARGWSLDLVLNTHHHWDHVGGNGDLKERYGCQVIGPAYDRDRLQGLDRYLSDGDSLAFGNEVAQVIYVPGHTLGHIVFYFQNAKALFCGDTLFSLGCGRLFEGTPEMMWSSLSKLKALPPATRVFCGHEYTVANAAFATFVDPENLVLRQRVKEAEAQRAVGQPTIPSTMASEVACNPFLRAGDASIRQHLGLEAASDGEVFAELRRRKDNFVG